MRFLFAGWLLAFSLAPPLSAQETPETPPPTTNPPPAAAHADSDGVIDMDTVTVSGVQPGPGLWRVSQGEHVLYILGTQSPLPKHITWRSHEVSQVLQVADEILGSPGVQVDADIGFFRGMLLLPSAMKAARNPDGATLQQLLPADTYARWSTLKQRYMGRDKGIEKKRPLIAVFQLYQEALSHSGMKDRGVIEPVIDEVLKKRKLKRMPTSLKISIDDPKAVIADFRKERLKPQDLECFRKTLDRIERDLPQMAERANAWAVGDIEAIRVGSGNDQQLACLSAWFDTDTARKLGLTDIEGRVRAQWLQTVETAMRKNRISFATVPVGDLLKPNGYLALLLAKGYTIEAP